MLLRNLGKRRDIEDVFAEKAKKMADVCEGIAIQALNKVRDMDTSPGNILTIEYVRVRLKVYGNYRILDLAARGESTRFICVDVIQDCLDAEWFKEFSFAPRILLREAAIFSAFVPFSVPFLPVIREKFRNFRPDFLEIPAPGLKTEPKSAASSLKNFQALSYFRDLLKFYEIPAVKFRVHVLFHLLFVILLSYIVVYDIHEVMSPLEGFIYITLLGFLVKEVREAVDISRSENLKAYILRNWNIFDIFAIFCGFSAFLMRLETSVLVHTPILVYISIVLLSVTCLVYWVRLLYVSVVLRNLGPKLTMMTLIIKKDLLPFLMVLFIFMFGFGVTFQALLFPGNRSLSLSTEGFEMWEVLCHIFTITFYGMIGAYYSDKKLCLKEVQDLGNVTLVRMEGECVHPTGRLLFRGFYLVVYVVISKILLLNLIIALFNKTIVQVDRISLAMWQFDKYNLIEELRTQSFLPPPFNILPEIVNIILWTFRKLGRNSGAPCVPRSPQCVEAEQRKSRVFLLFYYYLSLALRGRRHELTGVVQNEEFLTGSNFLLNNGLNTVSKSLDTIDVLEKTVKKLEEVSSQKD